MDFWTNFDFFSKVLDTCCFHRTSCWFGDMADFNTIATEFTKFYYQTFDLDRTHLAALYREKSMLTFEASAYQGVHNIIEKLTSLPFQKIQHRVDTTDAQPGNEAGAILVMVTGALMVDDQPQPMNYVQVFQLLPEAGTYFVQNDVFRLVYPAQ